MDPEVETYIESARFRLAEAEQALAANLPRMAAREAYLASFSAAQALILASTGKIAKTHAGVRSLFANLTKDSPYVPSTAARVLTGGYQQKVVADYGNSFRKTPITREMAADALDRARILIEQVERAVVARSILE